MTDSDFLFRCDYAKTNRSGCKKCKVKIDKGALRIAKLKTNPFSDDGGLMTDWHHPKCVFETFAKARATTKKIESPDDVEFFDTLEAEDQDAVKELIKDYLANRKTPAASKAKTPKKQSTLVPPKKPVAPPSTASNSAASSSSSVPKSSDYFQFSVLIELCDKLRSEPSYNAKSEIIQNFFKNNTCRTDKAYLLLKLMIPSVDKRVYNVKDKQLVKILSAVFSQSTDNMSEHLEQGDVGKTGKVFYQKSHLAKPSSSAVSLQQVDEFLQKLTSLTRDDEQRLHFKSFMKHLTPKDLKYVLYLIKKDLKINAREKHILEGFHPVAYQAFQMSHDLRDVVTRYGVGGAGKLSDKNDVGLQLMTPIRPMLAEACKSIAQALGKCPTGMYSEIKYDGERVQLHKQGDRFEFFSRSLKPVMPHKVADVSQYILQAFPTGQDMILDCEVLLVDNNTGKPLPFGTLGIHKKSAFKSASVCLFVFDILLLNDECLVKKPVKKRRQILSESMTEIPNRVLLSEMKLVNTASELAGMISHVLREGLEGLVLKGVDTIYEPGKRHWLKVKKDYLQGGAMADSADLVVLGGYFGTGNKGGMCSVFLMGCYCPTSGTWKTVCKVGNGHDDATLDRISKNMISKGRKIKGDYNAKPRWLDISRGLMPDYIVLDPKDSPVWEITGAEFSQSSVHTAGGISIRFPRVTKIRSDKDWQTATDLPRLQNLMRTSQEKADEAIEKLMIKEGGGKLSMPSSSKSLVNGPGSSSVKPSSTLLGKRSPGASLDNSSPTKKKKQSHGTPQIGTLSNVLEDEKVYISSKIPEKCVLDRYCVGFGGELVADRKLADIIVLNKDVDQVCGNVRVVSKDWFISKIKS